MQKPTFAAVVSSFGAEAKAKLTNAAAVGAPEDQLRAPLETPAPLPQAMDYDPDRQRLLVGKGFVENVAPAMRAYEISGKNVLDQWFSYRRLDRTKPVIGDRRPPSPLEKIQPEHWLAEYTEDLLNLLNVLGRLVALEPRQADLMDRICAGPLIAFAAGGNEKPEKDADIASR